MAVVIDAGSFALRPFRTDAQHNEFVNYEAITFPEHPKAGCDLYLRRVALFGLVEDGDGPLGIDVLRKTATSFTHSPLPGAALNICDAL
ncbi:MAG: hypothetical protein ACYCSP_10365 [Acidobacteriaceae bacterium]